MWYLSCPKHGSRSWYYLAITPCQVSTSRLARVVQHLNNHFELLTPDLCLETSTIARRMHNGILLPWSTTALQIASLPNDAVASPWPRQWFFLAVVLWFCRVMTWVNPRPQRLFLHGCGVCREPRRRGQRNPSPFSVLSALWNIYREIWYETRIRVLFGTC